MSVREGLPATSTILRRARGFADECWSAHSSMASRCGPPFGAKRRLEQAGKWVAALGAADPALATAAGALAETLARTLPEDGARRLVHHFRVDIGDGRRSIERDRDRLAHPARERAVLRQRGDEVEIERAEIVECGEHRYEAEHVVVATGFYGTPSVPAFAPELDPRIVQMHSSEYRDPSQLRPGGVLLVGAGNSGADIAMEVSKTHRTWLSGRDKGQVPIRIESRLARFVLPILWFVASHVLTVKTPIGRKVRPHVLANGAPRIRVKADDLLAALREAPEGWFSDREHAAPWPFDLDGHSAQHRIRDIERTLAASHRLP